MRVLVTGAEGFIGRNLVLRLRERPAVQVSASDVGTPRSEWLESLAAADAVVHLAGINRPTDPADFDSGNAGSARELCEELQRLGRRTPVILSSSSQAAMDNPYGRSKRAAEDAVAAYGAATGAPYAILRLWNVFGKWARPNYNSAVATFCHNVARGLPVEVHDPAATIRLVYIDDVVDAIVSLLEAGVPTHGEVAVGPVHESTVGAVLASIRQYASVRETRDVPAVGSGFERKLYATYLSYLPPEDFGYGLQTHVDPRGMFAELLRTADSGQFSVFTAHPGVTRGGHYHHTKNEKFFVVQGRARFGFRHVLTQETHELLVDAATPRAVDTIPGWAHDITNVGDELLIVLLWANEAFDPGRPDTIPHPVLQ